MKKYYFLLILLGLGILSLTFFMQKEQEKTFTNLDPSPSHGLKEFIKWQLDRKKEKWPDFIPPQKNKSLHLEERVYKGSTISYIGHATFLIQTQGLNILTDPIWSMRCSPLSWLGPKRVREAAIPFDKLPPIDLVLIGHDHYDHMDIPSLKMLEQKFKPFFFVGLKNRKNFDKSFKNPEGIIEMDWWEEKEFKNIKIIFTPSKHFSGRRLNDRMKTLWGSFLIETKENFLYFASDTGYGSHFSLIYDKIIKKSNKSLEVALLPIGAYEPRWFMKSVHMNPEDAIKAKDDLHAVNAIPMHYGTFQLTDEGIDKPLETLKAIQALNFRELPFGESVSFHGGIDK